ncbi:phage major capsid protein [Oerskovia enterophila]|uniref:phage major capsid protein n=1 Tax=Oerskovia enterophila TaxID=43678 RepID=UPI00382FA1F7
MAITAASKTSDFAGFLKPDQAQAYFDQARKSSSFMQLARQVPLGINGAEVPVVTSKATAGWVAEGAQKPASKGAVGIKTITPKKIAAIAVVSAEVVRANPANYMSLLREDIAEAFAIAFDAAAFHGTNTPFAQYIDQTTKTVELGTTVKANGGVYGDIVAGLKLLVQDGKKLNGFAFDRVVEPTFLSAVDNNGRPLFVETPLEDTASVVTPGRLIGRNAYIGDGLTTAVVPGTPNTGGIVGYGGDWSQAVWGTVGGISYDVSTQATVTINGALTSLWENNLVAIRAEAEFGLLINDVASFVEYTDHTA